MLQLQQTCRCRGPGAVAPEVEEDEVPIVPPPVARPEGGSRCTSTWNSVRCSYSTTTIYGRTAYHQVPTGKAPSSGWPAVFIWHGWDLYAANSWQNSYGQPYGTFNKALLVKGLLDAGFAVITPVAISPGGYWYTNVRPFNYDAPSDLSQWNATSPDGGFLDGMLAAAASGSWGPIDMTRLHAAGFSSGGYMTSRLARWQYSVFRSLSINSGAMYYCTGADCNAPAAFLDPYFKEHPPTLFLQGTADDVVPPSTQAVYHNYLKSYFPSVPTKRVLQQGVGHQWVDAAPTEILAWIQAHNPPALPAAA